MSNERRALVSGPCHDQMQQDGAKLRPEWVHFCSYKRNTDNEVHRFIFSDRKVSILRQSRASPKSS